MAASFFEPGTAIPAIDSEAGVATLEMMARMAEYAHPDHLSQASNETQATWEAGQAALGIMWGSRGSVILDDEGRCDEVTENTVLAAAPMVEGIGIPGATLWWDGFTIAANVSDEEAEATFAALASALTPEMVAANNDDAVWLLEGLQPRCGSGRRFGHGAGRREALPDGSADRPSAQRAGRRTGGLHAGQRKRRAGAGRCGRRLYDAAREAGFLRVSPISWRGRAPGPVAP
jgi:multiple sugar transport system substrate-binding protein